MPGIEDWKREVLREGRTIEYRKKYIPNYEGLTSEQTIDQADKLEPLTNMIGWAIIEGWVASDASPDRILSLHTDFDRGFVKGEMSVMQRVVAMIAARDKIIIERTKKAEQEKIDEKSLDKE